MNHARRAGLLGVALLSACASTSAPPMGPAVMVPWRPGNAQAFQAGAAEERLGYDPQASADAQRQVIDFLAAHGLGPPGR